MLQPSYMLGQTLIDDDSDLTVFRNGAFRYKKLYFEPDLTAAATTLLQAKRLNSINAANTLKLQANSFAYLI
ncbi:hypothetical protein [Planococcus sp. ISL-110]|uniref:hypothetical protein n=1 Tax=Planococcus sp. ISL-110 TaxID=2819167 RepID=UPI002035444B|nr:hypothetical protein [Planococcus sp. ISL-110]